MEKTARNVSGERPLLASIRNRQLKRSTSPGRFQFCHLETAVLNIFYSFCFVLLLIWIVNKKKIWEKVQGHRAFHFTPHLFFLVHLNVTLKCHPIMPPKRWMLQVCIREPMQLGELDQVSAGGPRKHPISILRGCPSDQTPNFTDRHPISELPASSQKTPAGLNAETARFQWSRLYEVRMIICKRLANHFWQVENNSKGWCYFPLGP